MSVIVRKREGRKTRRESAMHFSGLSFPDAYALSATIEGERERERERERGGGGGGPKQSAPTKIKPQGCARLITTVWRCSPSSAPSARCAHLSRGWIFFLFGRSSFPLSFLTFPAGSRTWQPPPPRSFLLYEGAQAGLLCASRDI